MKQIAFLLVLSSAAFGQLAFPQLGGAPAPAEVKPDTVVATVEGKDITLDDVRKIVAADPRLMQYMQQNPQAAIAQYFLMRHLADEGEKRKIADQSPLKEQLETSRAIAIAGAMLNLERDTFGISEEQMQAYYQSKRANYEEAHIRGIYLAFQPPAAPAAGASPEDLAKAAQAAVANAQNKSVRPEAATEALAKDLVKQIRAGADFAKLVEQYSDDPNSKANFGDLGMIKPNGSFPEPIKGAVFPLKAGEIADPVKSGNAYYILQLVGKMMPEMATVRSELIQSMRQDHLNQYMSELTTRFKPAVKNADFFARPGALLNGAN